MEAGYNCNELRVTCALMSFTPRSFISYFSSIKGLFALKDFINYTFQLILAYAPVLRCSGSWLPLNFLTVPETEPPTSTTPVYEGCESSEFGCCFDNTTDAAGPDGQGCPCNISEFGCCYDGVSPGITRQ